MYKITKYVVHLWAEKHTILHRSFALVILEDWVNLYYLKIYEAIKITAFYSSLVFRLLK